MTPARRALSVVVSLVLLATLMPVAPAVAAQGFTVVRPTPTGDRFETSASIARTAFPDGVSEAYLVNGDNPVDALAVAPLAGPSAPILYTRRDSLPGAVFEVLGDLGITRVHVVGGTGSVSESVVSRLASGGRVVDRTAGSDRYATAALLADRVVELNLATQTTAVLVSGETLADALSAAPAAAATRTPLLLTARNHLPAATRVSLEAMTSLRHLRVRVDSVRVLGGPATVSDAVLDEVRPLGYLPTRVWRLAGKDRYETSVLAAPHGSGAREIGVANGERLVDALPGSVLLAQTGSSILLTRATGLDPGAVAYVTELQGSLVRGVVLGGPASVSAAVAQQLREAATAPPIFLRDIGTTDTTLSATVERRGDYRFELFVAPSREGDGPAGYVPVAAEPPRDAIRIPFPVDGPATVEGLRPHTRYDGWIVRRVADLPATTATLVAATLPAPPQVTSVRTVPGASSSLPHLRRPVCSGAFMSARRPLTTMDDASP